MRFTRAIPYFLVLLLVAVSVFPEGTGEEATAEEFSLLPDDIPRNETLVLNMFGRASEVKAFNRWRPGYQYMPDWGYSYWSSSLWYQDVESGQWSNGMAEEKPDYNSDFTTMTVKLRENLKWSDGVSVTAEDLISTVEAVSSSPGLYLNTELNESVKAINRIDDFTVEFVLNTSNPRFHYFFTVLQCANSLEILPAHILKDVQDPLSYTGYPLVTANAYTLKDFDEAGYWFLFERREDWRNTITGAIAGKQPAPRYVFLSAYGPEDKQIIASLRHQLDINFFSFEAWEVLSKQNDHIEAWFDGYPWAWLNDPSSRNVIFNQEKAPFDNAEVRWALALAIDIVDLAISVYDGVTKPAVLFTNPNTIHTNAYYIPLEDWLRDFALADGYRPFDPTVADRLAEFASNQGHQLQQDPEDIWGIGWLKFDVDAATRILQSNGFSRDSNGKWLMPDGQPFKITITTRGVDYQRIALVVASYWRDFGIDANAEQIDPTLMSNRVATGDYEAIILEGESMGPAVDIWQEISGLHSKYYTPTGEIAYTNYKRWKAPSRVDAILDEISQTHPDDPKVQALTQEYLRITFEEMAGIPLLASTKMIIRDTYYWENWPSAQDPYRVPWYWCPGSIDLVLPHLQPTGRN